MNERFFGPELYGLYQETKQIFDPYNLFNPGNIVDGPAMTENLRFGAEYNTISLKTHLDFSDDQGFNRAVEMCNGAGVCRKKEGRNWMPKWSAVTLLRELKEFGESNDLRDETTLEQIESKLEGQIVADALARSGKRTAPKKPPTVKVGADGS